MSLLLRVLDTMTNLVRILHTGDRRKDLFLFDFRSCSNVCSPIFLLNKSQSVALSTQHRLLQLVALNLHITLNQLLLNLSGLRVSTLFYD